MGITKLLSFPGEGGGKELRSLFKRSAMFVDNLELNPYVRARGGHFVWAWLLLCLTPFQRERAPTKSAKSTPKERRRSSIQVAFKWDSPGVVIIIQHWKMKKAKQNKTKRKKTLGNDFKLPVTLHYIILRQQLHEESGNSISRLRVI